MRKRTRGRRNWRKATRKAEKEREAISKANEMAPVCKAHVDQGLDHVLTLKVPDRRDVLRYHFRMSSVDIDGVSKAIYKLNLAETTIALKRLMPPMPPLPEAEATGQTNHNEMDANLPDAELNGASIETETGQDNDVEMNAGGDNDVVA